MTKDTFMERWKSVQSLSHWFECMSLHVVYLFHGSGIKGETALLVQTADIFILVLWFCDKNVCKEPAHGLYSWTVNVDNDKICHFLWRWLTGVTAVCIRNTSLWTQATKTARLEIENWNPSSNGIHSVGLKWWLKALAWCPMGFLHEPF